MHEEPLCTAVALSRCLCFSPIGRLTDHPTHSASGDHAMSWLTLSGLPIYNRASTNPGKHFKSRSAYCSASIADLRLPRKSFHGSFPCAGLSCCFPGISAVACELMDVERSWPALWDGLSWSVQPGIKLSIRAGGRISPMTYREPLLAILEM